jgi:hypothetical protein
MTTPAPTGTDGEFSNASIRRLGEALDGIVHAPTVRPGVIGPGTPGHRIFESNFVVECPCGHRANIASLDRKMAERSAAAHLRDVENGWWKPPGWYRTEDDDFERDITYLVEYDEVIRRRCEVTIAFEADREAGSTAKAIEQAIENDEMRILDTIGIEYDINSWKEKT